MRIILNHKKHIALMVCILLCILMTWKTFSTILAASDTAAATDIQSEDTDDKLMKMVKRITIFLKDIVHFMIIM